MPRTKEKNTRTKLQEPKRKPQNEKTKNPKNQFLFILDSRFLRIALKINTNSFASWRNAFLSFSISSDASVITNLSHYDDSFDSLLQVLIFILKSLSPMHSLA